MSANQPPTPYPPNIPGWSFSTFPHRPNEFQDLNTSRMLLQEPIYGLPPGNLSLVSNGPHQVELMQILLQPTSHIYCGSTHPFAFPELRRIWTRFRMSKTSYALGIHEFNLWLCRQDTLITEELKFLLQNACDSFDQLKIEAPSLTSDWTRCQQCLRPYLDAIELGGLQIGMPPVSPDGPMGSSPPDSMDLFATTASSFSLPLSRITSSDQRSHYSVQRNTPSPFENSTRGQDNNPNWSSPESPWNRKSPAEDTPFVEQTSKPFGFTYRQRFDPIMCDVPMTGNFNKLDASAATMALRGWIYYGQIFATSFSIYARVYIRLIQLSGRPPEEMELLD